jgi:hypothetical protein
MQNIGIAGNNAYDPGDEPDAVGVNFVDLWILGSKSGDIKRTIIKKKDPFVLSC